MAINIVDAVYVPNFNMFSRPVVMTHTNGTVYKKRIDNPAMDLRGIFTSTPVDVIGLDNTRFSDNSTTLDIIDREWPAIPQHAKIYMPATDEEPVGGTWEVMNKNSDGEGGTELVLKLVVAASP